MTTTEHLKDGAVTYSQSDALVTSAKGWLHEYLMAFGARRPGDMEDDFCGEPTTSEMDEYPLGRWRESPFYPALARLIDKGVVRWWKADDGGVWYAVANSPSKASEKSHAP